MLVIRGAYIQGVIFGILGYPTIKDSEINFDFVLSYEVTCHHELMSTFYPKIYQKEYVLYTFY